MIITVTTTILLILRFYTVSQWSHCRVMRWSCLVCDSRTLDARSRIQFKIDSLLSQSPTHQSPLLAHFYSLSSSGREEGSVNWEGENLELRTKDRSTSPIQDRVCEEKESGGRESSHSCSGESSIAEEMWLQIIKQTNKPTLNRGRKRQDLIANDRNTNVTVRWNGREGEISFVTKDPNWKFKKCMYH